MCAQINARVQKEYLHGQSYLTEIGIELKFLDELASLLFIKNELHVKPGYEVLTYCIIDISEKIGFLFLARDYIKQLKAERAFIGFIKYHFYNFVYDCKACLDSIAVLLNHQLKLGFEGGERDLGKGKFRRVLETKSKFFKDFSKKFGSWCDTVIEYRKRIIHQIGIPILNIIKPGQPWTPSSPLSIPKQAKSLYDLKDYEKEEYVSILNFCQDSIKNMVDIAEAAFCEIYENIRSTSD